MRHEGEVAWHFSGDEQFARRYMLHARKLYAQMQSWNETAHLSRRFVMADGAVIHVTHNDGLPPIVHIDVRHAATEQDTRLVPELWIPEGFVLTPITDETPGGWGTPVVQAADPEYPGDDAPFAPVNRAPGLDVSRWTEGGTLAQVIVTQKVNNGYPEETPLDRGVVYTPSYHSRFGPKPTYPESPEYGDWQAFRIEYADTSAQTSVIAEDRAELRDYKRRMFKLVNDHRVSVDLAPFALLPRGWMNIGQAQANLAAKYLRMGHMVTEYPSTFKTYNDRGGKNGSAGNSGSSEATKGESVSWFSNDILVFYPASSTPEYYDVNGVPVYSFAAASSGLIPTATALDGWLDSTRHRAIVESPLADDPYWMHVSVDFGAVPGATIMNSYYMRAWVQAGNRQFISDEHEIPIVSWNGFPHENLAFETWRVRMVVDGDGMGLDFTYRTYLEADDDWIEEYSAPNLAPATGSSRSFRLKQRYATRDAISGVHTHSLGAEIYMRGRCVAIAPNAGIVLAAAVRKFGTGATAYYRLYALCHHKDDQPENIVQEGSTRYVRLWYSDMLADDPVLRRDGTVVSLPCHPQTVIRKVYGEERDVHPGAPFVELYSQNSWRGGDMIDVGRSGLHGYTDLRKYDSMWRFNKSATKAVCIRSSFNDDYVNAEKTKLDLVNEVGADANDPGTWLGTWYNRWMAHMSITQAYYVTSYDMGTGLAYTSPSYVVLEGRPVICEIDVESATCTFDAADEYGTVLPYYYGRGASTPVLAETPTYVRPVVAYYGDDNTVRCLHRVTYNQFMRFNGHFVSGELEATYTIGQRVTGTHFVGYARGSKFVPTEAATLFSHDVGFDDAHIAAFNAPVFYVDDQHVMFAASGVVPAWQSDAIDVTVTNPVSPVGATLATTNPAWVGFMCGVEGTAAKVNQYRLWLDGELVQQWEAGNPYSTYAHPTMSARPDIISAFSPPFDVQFMLTPLNVCGQFYGGFAYDKNGEYVWSCSVIDQPYGAIQRNSALPEFTYTCEGGGNVYMLHPLTARFTFNTSYWGVHKGGIMGSSFMTQTELASIMQVPGSNPRSTDVRAV